MGDSASLKEIGPVAQLDRALRFERRGWEFKSLRVRHPKFEGGLLRAVISGFLRVLCGDQGLPRPGAD